MNKLHSEFLDLIDKSLLIAKEIKGSQAYPEWQKENASTYIKNLESIRTKMQSGELHNPGGSGLGIVRFLSECEAPENLYEAGRQVEGFFMQNKW